MSDKETVIYVYEYVLELYSSPVNGRLLADYGCMAPQQLYILYELFSTNTIVKRHIQIKELVNEGYITWTEEDLHLWVKEMKKQYRSIRK